MDKAEMKGVMERIEKKLKGQITYRFMENGNKRAWTVMKELRDDNRREYEFNGVRYNIEYVTSTTDSPSYRSTTAEFQISRRSGKTLFNADEVLSKREINVRHYHGGELKDEDYKKFELENPVPFLDDGSILDVVGALYQNSSYNIMIQRHGTGDVTIWIDEGRFNQR